MMTTMIKLVLTVITTIEMEVAAMRTTTVERTMASVAADNNRSDNVTNKDIDDSDE